MCWAIFNTAIKFDLFADEPEIRGKVLDSVVGKISIVKKL